MEEPAGDAHPRLVDAVVDASPVRWWAARGGELAGPSRVTSRNPSCAPVTVWQSRTGAAPSSARGIGPRSPGNTG